MADFGSIAGGAASGAAAGSSFGPWGTLAGGVLGAAGGLFGGKKKKKKKVSTLDDKQKALYDQYVESVYGGNGAFSDLYNFDADAANRNFDAMYSRPAYRNFQEKVVPGITGQFRNNNIMNSSYTGEALSRAGRDVQENLDAQRGNMIYQGQQEAMNRKQSAIDKILGMQTFAYDTSPRNPSAFDQLLGSAAKYGGEYFANYMNKPSFP